MARYVEKSAHCPSCNERRLAKKKAPRHGLHIVMTLLTGGVWVIVAAYTYLLKGIQLWRCQVCGSEVDMRTLR